MLKLRLLTFFYLTFACSLGVNAIETVGESLPKGALFHESSDLPWEWRARADALGFSVPAYFEGREEILGGTCIMMVTRYTSNDLEIILSIADKRKSTVYLEALTLRREVSASFWGFDYSVSHLTTETELRASKVRVSRNIGLRFKNQSLASRFEFSLEMSEFIEERDSLGNENLRGRTLYYCPLLTLSK